MRRAAHMAFGAMVAMTADGCVRGEPATPPNESATTDAGVPILGSASIAPPPAPSVVPDDEDPRMRRRHGGGTGPGGQKMPYGAPPTDGLLV
jgi:hypothetical protein